MADCDRMFDALELLRAHVDGRCLSEHLDSVCLGDEACLRATVIAQTRLARLLVTILAEEERRTPQQVLDSLAVALMSAAGDS